MFTTAALGYMQWYNSLMLRLKLLFINYHVQVFAYIDTSCPKTEKYPMIYGQSYHFQNDIYRGSYMSGQFI